MADKWDQFSISPTPQMPMEAGRSSENDWEKYVYSPPGGKVEVKGSPASPTSADKKTWADKINDFLRPMAAGAAGFAAGEAVFPAGGGIPGALMASGVGAGTYFGVDHLLNKLKDNPSSFGDESKDAATNFAIQELGGKLVVNPLMRGAANLLSKGTDAGLEAFKRLKPTFSQYMAYFGKPSPTAAWIEDIAAAGSKKAAIQQSARIGKGEFTDLASTFSGRTAADVQDPHLMASRIQAGAENQVQRLYAEADQSAEAAKLFGKMNSQVTKVPWGQVPEVQNLSMMKAGKPFNQLNQQEQLAIIQLAKQNGIQQPQQNIPGPVRLENSIQVAADYLRNKNPSLVPPDPDSPMVKAANHLLEVTNAQFDNNGKLIDHDPISFENAWDWKKQAGEYAWGDRSKGTAVEAKYIDKQFKDFSRAIDSDMENSIKGWKNGSIDALKSWRNASAMAKTRFDIFAQKDGLSQLIDNQNTSVPFIDKILSDPKQVDRAMRAGSIDLPNGKILSNNMREDLRGYYTQKLFNDNVGNDGKINTENMLRSFQDPLFAQTKRTLFSQAQEKSLSDLINNLNITQKQMSSMGWFGNPKLWITGAGMNLAGHIFAGNIMGGITRTAGVASVRLSAGALGKLMASPQTASVLATLAKGGALGQSEKAFSRTLVNALNGYRIAITDNKGNDQYGTVRQGNFEPEE